MSTNSWIAVASAEHVRIGRAQGFMQVCHGKAAPLRRLAPGDRIAYYSPTESFGGKDRLQAFTAIGVVAPGLTLSSRYGRRRWRLSPGCALERGDRNPDPASARKPVVFARHPELGLPTPVRPVPDRRRRHADHRGRDAGDVPQSRGGGDTLKSQPSQPKPGVVAGLMAGIATSGACEPQWTQQLGHWRTPPISG
jgi:EVE domain-containing protein